MPDPESKMRTLSFARKPDIRTLVVVVLLSLFSAQAQAQFDQSRADVDSSGLMIEAVAGWDGIVDQSSPVPFSFMMRNDSNRNIEGALVLHDFFHAKEIILGDVVIAPGTSRRFTAIQSMNNCYECVATFRYDGRILWRRQLDLTTGESFHDSVNYVLFVDENGRRLSLPGALTGPSSTAVQQQPIAGLDGRPIRTVAVKPWQIPNHPGPLIVAQAMVFPDTASERTLNQTQWRAVADWMCQGGHVIVHRGSRELINRLIESAPLSADVATESGALQVRRCGLGAIHEYSQPLLSNDASELRQNIADLTAKLGRNHINTFNDRGYMQLSETEQSDRNLITVGLFFVAYTFLTGVMTLMLFRLSQRRIAIYIVAVVVGASIISGVIGGMLQYSQGDLNWLTVTELGAGGLVQVGSIDVRSAGGHNKLVAIHGEHPDLQFIPSEGNGYYHHGNHQSGYSPFNWQPNLVIGEENAYQISVPMSPWGRRRCHASAFKRSVRGIDFELAFAPRDAEGTEGKSEESAQQAPKGKISLKVVNRLPFDLRHCWVVIGITRKAQPQPQNTQGNQFQGQYPRYVYQQQAMPVDGLIDLYHLNRLQSLSSGETRELNFDADFKVSQWNEMAHYWPDGSQIPPRLSRVGAASAWIVARINKSPILGIDTARTDFVPQQQTHFYVQEILPDDIPESLQFHLPVQNNSDTKPDEPDRSLE